MLGVGCVARQEASRRPLRRFQSRARWETADASEAFIFAFKILQLLFLSFYAALAESVLHSSRPTRMIPNFVNEYGQSRYQFDTAWTLVGDWIPQLLDERRDLRWARRRNCRTQILLCHLNDHLKVHRNLRIFRKGASPFAANNRNGDFPEDYTHRIHVGLGGIGAP